MKKAKASGVIYFIVSFPYVKIGYSHNVSMRLATLQTGNPQELHVGCYLDGDESDEILLHNFFDNERNTHGGSEWFLKTKRIEYAMWYVINEKLEHRDITARQLIREVASRESKSWGEFSQLYRGE